MSFSTKRVVDAGLDEEAVGAHAGLPGVAIFGDHRALDRPVDVGIVEDDEGRVAAKLHGDALESVRGLLDEKLADRRRAGEGDLADGRVAGQLAADLAR